MTDAGYFAEGECDMTSIQSSDYSCPSETEEDSELQLFFCDVVRRKSKRQRPNFVKEMFLEEMYGRRQRREVPHFVLVLSSREGINSANATPSQFYASKPLNQYFTQQRKMARGAIVKKKIPHPASTQGKEENFEKALSIPRRDMASITLCQRISVDYAVSFSFLPRVLIEADLPYRVVYVNAAYGRRYGPTQAPASARFEAPNVENHQELIIAVASLFDACDSLAMYAVCGSDVDVEGDDEVPTVTHFLFEADDSKSLVHPL